MNLSLSVTPKSITTFLLKIIFWLFLANIISIILQLKGYRTAFGFAPLFHFDMEFNVPSFYSFLAILFCGLLLRFIYIDERNRNGKKKAIYWKVLSYIFIYLSFDELISLHEHLGGVFHYFTGNIGNLNDSRYWVFPYAILLTIFLIFFIRFFLQLPNYAKVGFFVAGFIYVSGAVGVELFSGQLIKAHPRAIFIYTLISIFEELLEMIGIVLFIRSLVKYIAINTSSPYINLNLIATKSSRNYDK